MTVAGKMVSCYQMTCYTQKKRKHASFEMNLGRIGTGIETVKASAYHAVKMKANSASVSLWETINKFLIKLPQYQQVPQTKMLTRKFSHLIQLSAEPD